MEKVTATVELPDGLTKSIEQLVQNSVNEAINKCETRLARNSNFPMYMTKAQTADYLGISLNTLDRWIKSGVGIPFKYIGGSYRFNRVAVDKFMLSE